MGRGVLGVRRVPFWAVCLGWRGRFEGGFNLWRELTWLCRGHVRLYKEWDVLEGGGGEVSNGDADGRFAGQRHPALDGRGLAAEQAPTGPPAL